MSFAQFPPSFQDAGLHSMPCVPRRTAAWSKTKMCKFFPLGMCCQGSDCNFAHDESELQTLPDLARTKICRSLVTTGTCTDSSCTFAHTRDELRGANPDVRRSRGPCRFWLRGNCVLGERCTHAHEHIPEWEEGSLGRNMETNSQFPSQRCPPSSSAFNVPTYVASESVGQMVFTPQWTTGMVAVPIAIAAPQQALPSSLSLDSPPTAHTANYRSQDDFGDSPLPTPRQEPKLAAKCDCGNAFLKDCRFCRMCGSKRLLEPIVEKCQCGAGYLQDALFCNCCGTKRPNNVKSDEDRETCLGEDDGVNTDTTEIGSDSASNSDLPSDNCSFTVDVLDASGNVHVFGGDSLSDHSDDDCTGRRNEQRQIAIA